MPDSQLVVYSCYHWTFSNFSSYTNMTPDFVQCPPHPLKCVYCITHPMGEFFLFCTLCCIKEIFVPTERTDIDQTDIRKLENRKRAKPSVLPSKNLYPCLSMATAPQRTPSLPSAVSRQRISDSRNLFSKRLTFYGQMQPAFASHSRPLFLL